MVFSLSVPMIWPGPLPKPCKNGIRTIVADQAWENIKAANMQGLRAYWGNVVSVHAENHLDLSGIGGLVALSANNDLNALAARH